MEEAQDMTKEEWLDLGVQKGYCTQYCYIHDDPITDEEAEIYFEDVDLLCIPIARLH